MRWSTELQTISLRNERARDAMAIRRVIEQAFGQTAEADLVEALRRSGALAVSLVAEIDGEVVGYIAFSPVTIQSWDSSHDALGLAPLAVSPAHQRRGIGSKLVRHGLDSCRLADTRWHLIDADEIWHFYAGSALEFLVYDPQSLQLTRQASYTLGSTLSILFTR